MRLSESDILIMAIGSCIRLKDVAMVFFKGSEVKCECCYCRRPFKPMPYTRVEVFPFDIGPKWYEDTVFMENLLRQPVIQTTEDQHGIEWEWRFMSQNTDVPFPKDSEPFFEDED